MTKDNNVNNNDELQKDLENLDLKIKDALSSNSLSEEGLKALIKETEGIQKRLIHNAESTQEEEENE
jgi:hypothetical protein